MDEATLLKAISTLKDELVTIINTGIDRVQTSVSQLQAEHTRALLEQAERNARFASREDVESLRRTVDRNSTEIARLHEQDNVSANDRKDLHATLVAMERAGTQGKITALSKGYAAMGAAALATVGIIAQLFFHFWH